MDYNNKEQEIRALLEKYFEAATSLEEEARLKDYFLTQKELPSDLLYARQWFGYLGEAASEVLSGSDFPLCFTGSDRASDQDSSAKTTIAAKADDRVAKKSPGLFRQWLWPAISVAAALTAMLMLVQPGHNNQQDMIFGYVNGVPLTDSRQAAIESQKALNTMGRQLSKPAHYLDELDQMDQSLNKSLVYLSSLENVNP